MVEDRRLLRDRYYVLAEPNTDSVVESFARGRTPARRHEGALGFYRQWDDWAGLHIAVYSYPDADEENDPMFESCLPDGQTGTRLRVTGRADLPSWTQADSIARSFPVRTVEEWQGPSGVTATRPMT